jgi:hypothetical protein
MQRFLDLSISKNCSTCFRRFLRFRDILAMHGHMNVKPIEVLPDDGPVKSETWRALMFFKKYCCKPNDIYVHFLVKIIEI